MQHDVYLHLPDENLMKILKVSDICESPIDSRDPVIFLLGQHTKVGAAWTRQGDTIIFIFAESFHII